MDFIRWEWERDMNDGFQKRVRVRVGKFSEYDGWGWVNGWGYKDRVGF